MSALDQFRKGANLGFCRVCRRQTLIQVDHCFICATTPGAIYVSTSEGMVMLAAMSLMIDTLKPPKKPKQPKLEGPVVRPMTRRK